MSDAGETLSPAQRSRIRRLSQPKEPAPGEEAGELNVVPYLDIITNVMIFVLASVSVIFITSIDSTPPAIGGGKVRSEAASKALNLSALVTSQGISLKTSGGNIAPGCAGVGAGVTIPMVDKMHDYAAVTACAKRLKGAQPEFAQETQVTLTANADVQFQVIVSTMDALRRDGEEELFPDVHFGVAR
ncbi:biopolymer transporter ExbD [Chondromyces crocatus]|uniref:TolR-like protein n=1 Tax=Chondromyces crocatus TaxID=52 RepID=A0A0K1EH40_CHOCO|nr:biopolymer transporter ExbD [Chondromyces crocatus]AKT40175.1 TolR-like protein [Chondromyces crocatus]